LSPLCYHVRTPAQVEKQSPENTPAPAIAPELAKAALSDSSSSKFLREELQRERSLGSQIILLLLFAGVLGQDDFEKVVKNRKSSFERGDGGISAA